MKENSVNIDKLQDIMLALSQLFHYEVDLEIRVKMNTDKKFYFDSNKFIEEFRPFYIKDGKVVDSDEFRNMKLKNYNNGYGKIFIEDKI